jgi:hypothetical protein
MKIIKSILSLVKSPEVITAEELEIEDPSNALELIEAHEKKVKEIDSIMKDKPEIGY